jgi:hypothetical protein
MAVKVLRVANAYPAGLITPPVTTPPAAERPLVTAAVQWDDGRSGDVHGVALSWNSDAILVLFTGPDGIRRQVWMPVDVVRKRRPRGSSLPDGWNERARSAREG